jgi:hypothetical protein
MLSDPTLEEVIQEIRDFHAVPERIEIDANTELERQLGITGDDMYDLFSRFEDKYLFSFTSPEGDWWTAFGISEGFYLFNGEFSSDPEKVFPLTAGQLHLAILRRLHRA